MYNLFMTFWQYCCDKWTFHKSLMHFSHPYCEKYRTKLVQTSEKSDLRVRNLRNEKKFCTSWVIYYFCISYLSRDLLLRIQPWFSLCNFTFVLTPPKPRYSSKVSLPRFCRAFPFLLMTSQDYTSLIACAWKIYLVLWILLEVISPPLPLLMTRSHN